MVGKLLDELILETDWYTTSVRSFCKTYNASESHVHKRRKILNCDYRPNAKVQRNRNTKGQYSCKYYSSSESENDSEININKHDKNNKIYISSPSSLPTITNKFTETKSYNLDNDEECLEYACEIKKQY